MKGRNFKYLVFSTVSRSVVNINRVLLFRILIRTYNMMKIYVIIKFAKWPGIRFNNEQWNKNYYPIDIP
ncbi:hypothetical protein DU508_05365 [Pedobacter chinensis]|uniref:Uncharacterized protein n=1 Tax=Pedobacter chinensis TaxID=2282421 RepID=A0A369Q0F5_9SPHI|nr:hypothetical protein DU508_05365 [Pedobacter chinensis]